MTNRKSYTGFPTSHQPRFYAAPNFLNMGIKYLNLSSLIQFHNNNNNNPICKAPECQKTSVATIKDEKSAAKFHYIKNVSSKIVAQSIAFRVVSICWQAVAPFPWYLHARDRPPIGSAYVPHTSPHSAAVVHYRHYSLRSAHWLASDFHSWINSWIDCQTSVYTI